MTKFWGIKSELWQFEMMRNIRNSESYTNTKKCKLWTKTMITSKVDESQNYDSYDIQRQNGQKVKNNEINSWNLAIKKS